MALNPVKIAVTCGEPAGIGPEVALKALGGLSGLEIALVGPEEVWESAAKRLGVGIRPDFEIVSPEDSPKIDCQPGKMTPSSALCATLSAELATRMALSGEVDAVVTAPLTKEGLRLSGRHFPGHTELLADMCGVKNPTMAFFGGSFIVSLATTHLPLREVAGSITSEAVLTAISNTCEALKKHMAVQGPRIGVCGLNPHAGENGLLGDEEQKIISPAIAEAIKSGIDAVGPLPADAIFVKLNRGDFDAVVALYHDQGLGPFKLLHFNDGVNVTLGLPIIRTSPDHGTAFEIAHRGIADPGSMAEAIRLAAKMASNVKDKR